MMDKLSLPLTQEQLINFVMHHIHAWSNEFMDQEPDQQYMLSDIMREDYQVFISVLDQLFQKKIKEFE